MLTQQGPLDQSVPDATGEIEATVSQLHARAEAGAVLTGLPWWASECVRGSLGCNGRIGDFPGGCLKMDSRVQVLG